MSVLKALENKTYLTFQLGEEIFAVDVQNVHEVLEFSNVTKLPGTPDFMRGIINLRGKVVPIVDMRLKFGMPETDKTDKSCVIVMEISKGENKRVVGALADSVKEVFEFDHGQIEPPPRIGEKGKMDFIQGIGKREDKFVIILNFDRVFTSEEVVMLGSMEEMSSVQNEDLPSEEET